MALKIGSAANHNDLFDQFRLFIEGFGTFTTPVYSGTGNGTITAVNTFPATVTETWTLSCITAVTNGGVFSVTGSVTGATANATVGTLYSNGKITFTINDGSIDFSVGNNWTIATTIGVMGASKWLELEWSGAITNRLLQLRAPGLSGTEQIFVGLRSYESIPSDYYNLSVFGATGYVSGNTYLTQPGFSGAFGVPMWNQAIPYWLVGNGQRAIVVAKIQTVFESFYIGKMLPLGATPSQYPYPLMIGRPAGHRSRDSLQ